MQLKNRKLRKKQNTNVNTAGRSFPVPLNYNNTKCTFAKSYTNKCLFLQLQICLASQELEEQCEMVNKCTLSCAFNTLTDFPRNGSLAFDDIQNLHLDFNNFDFFDIPTALVYYKNLKVFFITPICKHAQYIFFQFVSLHGNPLKRGVFCGYDPPQVQVLWKCIGVNCIQDQTCCCIKNRNISNLEW